VSANGDRLERYAELAVRVGANVQPGQEVFVHGLVEHVDFVRACHIAYGFGIANTFDGEPDERINVSNIHVDFMVGEPELEVDAVLADGTEVPLINNEEWQLAA
jgi:leucyl aminopeptidase (aminopeptidase T)